MAQVTENILLPLLPSLKSYYNKSRNHRLLLRVCTRTHADSQASHFNFGYVWSVLSMWLGTVFCGYITILILVPCRSTNSGYGSGEKKKKKIGTLRRLRPAKNVYTNSLRLTLNCRVTWCWSERLNLYNWQVITQQRKGKNMLHYWASGPLLTAKPWDLYRLFPPLSVLVSCAWYSLKRCYHYLKCIKNMFSHDCRYKTNYNTMQVVGDKTH